MVFALVLKLLVLQSSLSAKWDPLVNSPLVLNDNFGLLLGLLPALGHGEKPFCKHGECQTCA